MLCRAAIVPCQFFWNRVESQKISTCDFFFFFSPTNTRVPPAVRPSVLFFVYRRCNLKSFEASGNVRDCNCLHFNDGEVFLWLGKVLIGRVWKGAAAIEETTGKLIALHVPLLLFLCPSLSHSPFMYQIKKKSIFFQTWPEHLIPLQRQSRCGPVWRRVIGCDIFTPWCFMCEWIFISTELLHGYSPLMYDLLHQQYISHNLPGIKQKLVFFFSQHKRAYWLKKLTKNEMCLWEMIITGLAAPTWEYLRQLTPFLFNFRLHKCLCCCLHRPHMNRCLPACLSCRQP